MIFSWFSSGIDSIETVNLGILFYNIIAFGLQPIIGYVCDTYKRIPIAAYGYLLLIIGLFSMNIPTISIILMATGNACFHIGGGIDSLRYAEGKMVRSGIFVSSGALGVVLGTLAGKSNFLSMYFPVGLLLICIILFFVFCSKQIDPQCLKTTFAITNPKLRFETIILLASISIIIRSYAGSILPIEWRTTTILFLFPAIGAFIGKASGGYLADKFGAKRIGIMSLTLAAILLSLGYMNPWIYLIGIAFFNVSMSITLCSIASQLNKNPGLAFGITTLALLCGNVPTFFFTPPLIPVTFALLTIFSVICLQLILKGGRKI